jgi:DNA modification methylase
MPAESQPYLSSEFQAQALAEFLARHVKPYDPATDEYDRPPFAEDIKEGKNDPIYNAHSYHTKVPPRSIIPYILHYTQPGDVVLDAFCGSGMTGVAAQMCATPPEDLLAQFPELKSRVGSRACILNDLSPAACHIAYNYNTPVDVDALRNEFERIKGAVKDEFNWLYGTEHYEPAIGPYSPKKPDVLARLKNPPVGAASARLLDDSVERTWELLPRAEVESRLGYPVTELPRDNSWDELDVSKVEDWVCIPATIQYTIWSDVYRCEGFVTVDEPTGKISTRGKNAGKPIVRQKKVARGCGELFVLYDVAMDKETTKVHECFTCPACNQEWTVDCLTLLRADPVDVVYQYSSIEVRSDGTTINRKSRRKTTKNELSKLQDIEASPIIYWYPTTALVPGEQGNPFIGRGLVAVHQLYTARNLRASARLWNEFDAISDERIRSALTFAFTSVSARSLTRMTRYRKRGNEALAMRLFIPHFQAEINPLKVLEGKFKDIEDYYAAEGFLNRASAVVLCGPAQDLKSLPDGSVDFVFVDPPFGRNIAYAELNVLWESWLGRLTDIPKEAITSNGRKWGVESYVEKMKAAFREIFRVLKPNRFAMIEFNNGDPELGLFEHIKQSALSAGFQITNMMVLDKEHRSFNQIVGVLRGEDTVDKDVVFNLQKPAIGRVEVTRNDHDLEHHVTEAVRRHLLSLPARIAAEPAKYSDEHRTTATINSMLMNTLIPRGVSVEQLTLPFIERACSRYFRKIGPHWYLRGEAVGGNGNSGLFEEEIAVKDDLSAIDWLRQKLRDRPMLVGEIKPLWMRATGLLSSGVSQGLILEDLLVENFWRDQDTNRWREPTDEERERMNDDRSTRVLHDAERYFASTLRRQTTDAERCEWIDVLFKACRQVEEGDVQSTPTLRDFDIAEGYRLITRLFQSVLRDHVSPDEYSKASKQASVASNRVAEGVRQDEAELAALHKKKERTLFD